MRKFLYILVLTLIYSCTSNTIFKKPDDLIPKDEMVDLLTDMYIASAANSSINIYKETGNEYTNFIFEKYGIDSTRFKRSNFYYITKIDEYEEIYDEVNERLQKLNQKYLDIEKNEILRAREIKDSLVKVAQTKDSLFFVFLNKKAKDTTQLFELTDMKKLLKKVSIDSLRKNVWQKDSLFLDSLNKKVKDSTLFFNLKDSTYIKKFISIDRLREDIRKKDTISLDSILRETKILKN